MLLNMYWFSFTAVSNNNKEICNIYGSFVIVVPFRDLAASNWLNVKQY